MCAASAAHMKIRLELAVEQHLLAAGAFVPEIVRDRLSRDDRANLRQHKIAEPAHRWVLSGSRLFVEHRGPAMTQLARPPRSSREGADAALPSSPASGERGVRLGHHAPSD